MQNILLACLLLLLSLNMRAQSVSADQYPSDVARDWFKTELYLIKTVSGNTPPVASRSLGYSGLTLYESIVSGIPDYLSLESSLDGSPSFTDVDPAKTYHWPTVANNALATVIDSLFANATQAKKDTIHAHKNMWNALYQGSIDSAVFADSKAYGQQLGWDVFDYSKTDGGYKCYLSNTDASYVPPVCPQCWVPTPPAFGMAVQPHWGDRRPFVAEDTLAPVIPGPNPTYSTDTLSAFYAYAMQTYITKNNLTQAQKNIASYWADGGGSVTPPGHSISILNQILFNENEDLAFAALAYAKLGMSQMDAFIACWKTKYIHNLMRPVTYINANIDASWTSYIGTPAFPEYTSGHSSQSGAMAVVMSEMFGYSYAFTDSTHGTSYGGPRSFQNFDEAANEAALSRLFGGIHYEFSNVFGVMIGKMIGENINDLFESVHNPSACIYDQTITASGDTSFCEGGEVTLWADANAVSYLWSTGATTSSITVNQTGDYSCNLFYGAFCGSQNSSSIHVEVYSNPALDLGADVYTCAGPVTVNAGLSGLTYNWSTGATTQSISTSVSANYSLTVTDGNGCSSTDAVGLFIGNGIAVDLGADVSGCASTNVVLNAGNGYDTYDWSDGSSSQLVNIATSGNYSVTVTDGNGCSSTDDVDVDIYPNPSQPTITMNNNTLIADSGFVLYDWYYSGNYFATTPMNFLPINLSGSYSVKVYDANGCSSATSATFNAVYNAIEDLENASFSLYPNPAENIVVLSYSGFVINRVEVYDILGKLAMVSNDSKRLDISSLSSGLYMLKIYDQDNIEIVNTKLIKQ